MVGDGAGNSGSLSFTQIECPENPPRLVGPFPGMVLLLPLDVVKDSGHLGQGGEPQDPIGCICVFTLHEDDRGRIDSHLRDVAEPVSDPVRVCSEDGDGLYHEGVFPEQTAGCLHRNFLLAVKERFAHFPGDSPGYLLRLPVFPAEILTLHPADPFPSYCVFSSGYHGRMANKKKNPAKKPIRES
jgi:hypothetical protein